jgi:hypothetical protein
MGRSFLALLRRSFPELMIIVKGLTFAARSVCVFSLLWFIITYAFAIILRQLTEAWVEWGHVGYLGGWWWVGVCMRKWVARHIHARKPGSLIHLLVNTKCHCLSHFNIFCFFVIHYHTVFLSPPTLGYSNSHRVAGHRAQVSVIHFSNQRPSPSTACASGAKFRGRPGPFRAQQFMERSSSEPGFL